MSIYTKTGDKGTTHLGDGSRVTKSHQQIEVYGNIDELNSTIGIVIAFNIPENIKTILTRIQNELFDLGKALYMPDKNHLNQKQMTQLENTINELDAKLPPLTEFILPGGNLSASHCHLARAICRRAERSLVRLNEITPLKKEILQYINRLSDLLFVVARSL